MSHVFESDKRITDVWHSALSGKTIERADITCGTIFLSFTDGTFVYGKVETWNDNNVTYDVDLEIRDAHSYGLIQEDDPRYIAWKAWRDVEYPWMQEAEPVAT